MIHAWPFFEDNLSKPAPER